MGEWVGGGWMMHAQVTSSYAWYHLPTSIMHLLYWLVPALACCRLQVGTCYNIHSLTHRVAEVIFVEMSSMGLTPPWRLPVTSGLKFWRSANGLIMQPKLLVTSLLALLIDTGYDTTFMCTNIRHQLVILQYKLSCFLLKLGSTLLKRSWGIKAILQ